MQRREVLKFLRQMVADRTPYRHEGRNPVFGIDCIGQVTCVCDKFGYEYKDVRGYPSLADGKLIEHIEPWAEAVDLDDIKPADIGVEWCDRKTRAPQHIIQFTEQNTIIHVDLHVKRIVEVSYPPLRKKRLLRVFRFRGIVD